MDGIKIPDQYTKIVEKELGEGGKKRPTREAVLKSIVRRLERALQQGAPNTLNEESQQAWKAERNQVHRNALSILHKLHQQKFLMRELTGVYVRNGEAPRKQSETEEALKSLEGFLGIDDERRKEIFDFTKQSVERIQKQIAEQERGEKQVARPTAKGEQELPDWVNLRGKKLKDEQEIENLLSEFGLREAADLPSFSEAGLKQRLAKLDRILGVVSKSVKAGKKVQAMRDRTNRALEERKQKAEPDVGEGPEDESSEQKRDNGKRRTREPKADAGKSSSAEDPSKKTRKKGSKTPRDAKGGETSVSDIARAAQRRISELDRLKKMRNPEMIRQYFSSFKETRDSLERAMKKVAEQERTLEAVQESHGKDSEETKRLLEVYLLERDVSREALSRKRDDLESLYSEDALALLKREAGLTVTADGKGMEYDPLPGMKDRMKLLEEEIRNQEAVVKGNERERGELERRLNESSERWNEQLKKIRSQLFLDEEQLRFKQELEEQEERYRLEAILSEAEKLDFLKWSLEDVRREYETVRDSSSDLTSGDAAPETGESVLDPVESEAASESKEPGSDPEPKGSELELRADKAKGSGVGSEGDPKEKGGKVFASALDVAEQEFGIDLKGLKAVGFEKLSEGQQLMVMENLRQITLGRIQEEAEGRVEGKDKDTLDKRGRVLGSFWNFVSKHYRTAQAEKDLAFEGLRGGMGRHGEILRSLVSGMLENGPSVEYDDVNDRLDIGFLKAPDDYSEEEKTGFDAFNKTANAFARLPHEWGYATASKAEQARYANSRAEYDACHRELLELVSRKGDSSLVPLLYDAQAKMETMQLLNTHPEVEEYLGNLRDRSVWVRVFKETLTSKTGMGGLSFGLGMARRSLVAGALAVGAAPLVAASLVILGAGAGGGLMAKFRTEDAQRKRDKNSRRGKGDSGEQAANVVSGERLNAKLRALYESVERDAGREAELTQEEAEVFRKNIESLRARVQYTQRKVSEGRVDYGEDPSMRVAVHSELSHIAAQAATYVAIREWQEGKPNSAISKIKPGENDGDVSVSDTGMRENALVLQENALVLRGSERELLLAEDRLRNILDIRDDRLDDARKRYVRNQVVRGMAISSVAATAGTIFRDAIDGWFGGGEGGGRMADASSVGALKGDVGAPRLPGATSADATAVSGLGSGGSGAAELTASVKAPGTIAERLSGAKVFEVTAERGDGLTNLARKAAGEYLTAKGDPDLSKGLTAEHRVYIEDSIRRRMEFSGTLHPGDSVSVSRETIEEAIAEAKRLSPEQLRNLAPYADRVSEFRDLPRASAAAETVGSETGASVPDEPVSGSDTSGVEVRPTDPEAKSAGNGTRPGSGPENVGIPDPATERSASNILQAMRERDGSVREYLESHPDKAERFMETFSLMRKTVVGTDPGQMSGSAGSVRDLLSGIGDHTQAEDIPEPSRDFGRFIVASYEVLRKTANVGISERQIARILLPNPEEDTVDAYIGRISVILVKKGIGPERVFERMEDIDADSMVQFLSDRKLVGTVSLERGGTAV